MCLVFCKLFYIISQASHRFFICLIGDNWSCRNTLCLSPSRRRHVNGQKAHIQREMNSKYRWNEKHRVLLPSHVRKLSATHLRNVSKLRRSSLVKLYIDYLLLKQFQRAEVLSAQMWVQLQSGAQSKINIFLIRFFSGGSSREKAQRQQNNVGDIQRDIPLQALASDCWHS